MIELKKLGYKIIYLDTNAISDMSKNYKNSGKNILEKYFAYNNGVKYAFATSVYNISELLKTIKYRNYIINTFNQIPLLIIDAFPTIIDKELSKEELGLFGIGVKPIFANSISDLFNMLESDSFKETMKIYENNILLEIINWKEAKLNNLQEKQLFENSYKIYNKHKNDIDLCFQTKSSTIFTFIKSYFLYKQSKSITKNCVIDSYNASVAPFVDVYIGEKSVISWLEQSKDKYEFMKDIQLFKISEFQDKDVNND